MKTPPKINIEPENDGLEDDFPFQGSILRFHINLPGWILNPCPTGMVSPIAMEKQTYAKSESKGSAE